MLIFIYQIITKPLQTKPIIDEVCPVCGHKNTIDLTLYMRYIAMGIPLFGMGRRTGVVCTNCAHVLKSADSSIFAKKKYSANVAKAISDIRHNHKRTLWQLVYPWSIWFVMPFLVLILWGITLINKKRTSAKANQYKELLMHPKPGDIYKATWAESGMSEGALVKLMRINGDTMYIVKTRKNIPFSFSEQDWNKLESDPASFEGKEYKIKKFSALKKENYGDFFMYDNDENGREYPKFLGAVLNSECEMDLGFETIYRR